MDNKKSSGMCFTGVLTLIFVVLKLVGVINWSWFWVLSPLWISFLLVVFVIIFCIWIFKL